MDNKIFTTIMDKDFIVAAKKILEAEKYKKDPVFTPREEYNRFVIWYLIEIINKIKDIDAGSIFINFYPSNYKLRKKLSRSEYITYHLEFYYINIIGIFDRMLKIVNFLYDLGLPDKYITFDLIVSHNKIDNDIKIFFKKFNKALENIRKFQNNIKHKSKIYDKKLSDIDYYAGFISGPMSKLLKNKERNYFSNYVKSEYRDYLKGKMKEFKINNEQINIACDNFFTLLLPQYNKRLDNFK